MIIAEIAIKKFEVKMQKLLVQGGYRLNGEIEIGGMKNSALPVIYATILVKDECILENIPRVSDIDNSIEILRQMGAYCEFIDAHTLLINTKNLSSEIKGFDLISKMRASSYLMGTMLARFGKAYLPMPGGCNFGKRPIEQHIKGFESLGAKCIEDNGFINITTNKKLKSNKITLDKISVGATINIVLASIFLDGLTIIENSAMEPHVDDTIRFLNMCGAKILRCKSRIYIEGVKQLHSARYRIFPDMIESLTYMTFLGICGGDITLVGVKYEHIKYVCDIFRNMNFKIDTYEDEVRVRVNEQVEGANIITAPYPLFPTDLHPQFASLLCFSSTGGTIRDDVFPTRFAYAKELEKMGANIEKIENSVRIYPSKIHSATLDATDLRAGAALVACALGAQGESIINNVNYIVRGYEDIVGKVTSLGGKIKIIKET